MTHTNPFNEKTQEQLVLYAPTRLAGHLQAAESQANTIAIAALQTIAQHKPLSPFHPSILGFCHALSKRLLNKGIPELSALGYWLRTSNIKRWQASQQRTEGAILALGTVVHFAPANVDTMFVYSWVCSLLMGNNNIVRLSARLSTNAMSDSEITRQLLQAINDLYASPEFCEIAQRNVFITYPHNDGVSQQLSALADGRIIWGGDDSVTAIRCIPAKPKTRDIGFADRYSVALIAAESIIDIAAAMPVAEQLWRDIQPYSQMACSSPRTLFFLGNATQLYLVLQALEQVKLQRDVSGSPSLTKQNDHLIASQLALATGAANQVTQNQAITAVTVPELSMEIRDNLYQWHVGDGYLYVHMMTTLDNLAKNLDSRCQTLSYWGLPLQEVVQAFDSAPIMQIDRVVPLGQALDFSPIWDGYDLFHQLSRCVVTN